jgi:hypothetical protein
MEVVEHDDETSRCPGEVAEQQAGKADTLGTVVEAAAELRDRRSVIQACFERVS